MYRQYFKRIVDVLIAAPALTALSPLMLLTIIAICFEDRGSAFFRQKRVGQNGQLFEVIKFRSMPVNTKEMPRAQAGDLKVTRVGQLIRRTNIDELPQLINILQGKMSVVGPRPVLASQEEVLHLREANQAVNCKPGLTGLAQVNSYDDMPEAEKAKWDGQYAAQVSLLLDITTILRTFLYLTKRPPKY